MLAGSLTLRSLWTPKTINTTLWLDASEQSTLTTVSGAISEWRDKKNNGNVFSQSTPINRPLYSANTVTNSAQGVLVSPTIINCNTIALVAEITTYKNFGVLLSRENNEGGLHSATSGFYYFTGFTPSPPTSPLSRYYNGDINSTIPLGINGPAVSPLVQGKILFTLSQFTAPYPLKSILNLPDGSQPLAGKFYELVVLPTEDLVTIQKLEGYLAHKWDLVFNLPSNHPYKINPPRGL